MSVTRAQIVAEALSLVGTPFVHQGRDKGIGIDCVGVLVWLRRLGLAADYVDRRDYPRQPSSDLMGRLLDQHLVRVPVQQRLPADVVWMAWARQPQHLGILVARDRVVHAYGTDDGKTRTGRVVETPLTGSHLSAVRRVYRFRELTEGDN